MVASVHPSVIKRIAKTGEKPVLADPDFYKGLPSALAGMPADTINLLADLNKAQARVELLGLADKQPTLSALVSAGTPVQISLETTPCW